MLTIIMAITPVPRPRSGRQSAASFSQPNTADAANATITARTTVMSVPPIRTSPGSWSNAKAMIAPNVISSPCAKFVRPVVPKIIESPRAANASSEANTRPPTVSWRAWVNLPEEPASGSPIGKETAWSDVVVNRMFSSTWSGSRSAAPSGRVDSSIWTVKVFPSAEAGSPGMGMSNAPVSSVSSSPTTSPASSSTVTATPETGVGGVSRRSRRHPLIEIVVFVVFVLTPLAGGRRGRGRGLGRDGGDEAGEEHESQGSDRGQP